MAHPKTVQSVAYHEAGHGVMCWLKNLKINTLTIEPEEDVSGRVTHSSPLNGMNIDYDCSDRARLRMEKLVVVCCAGPIAQRKFNPKGYRRIHGSGDYSTAVDLRSYFSGNDEEVEAYLKLLEVRTKNALNLPHNWGIVKSLAEILLEKKTLKRKEIRVVIQEAISRRQSNRLY